MISLSEARIDREYKIKEIKDVPFKIKRRLFELGMLPNTSIKVERTSLLRRSYLIETGGYILTLRKDIVDKIFVSEKL